MKNTCLLAIFLACSPMGWTQDPGRAEFTSRSGKAYFAKPADDGVRAAEKALAENPRDLELLIEAGRAYDRVLQFSRSIPLYTRAIRLSPGDARAYRFRGHRYISTRKFREALTDLRKAEKIAPDSYDVLYHLALAQYLLGQFADSAATYGRCLGYTGPKSARMPKDWRSCANLDDDSLVAMMNWQYAALRRAGRDQDAGKLLEKVKKGMAVKENTAYLQALLLYKGELGESALESSNLTGSSLMALGYPIANFALMQGDTGKACALFQKLTSSDENWNAFGFIAAEVEIRRNSICRGK